MLVEKWCDSPNILTKSKEASGIASINTLPFDVSLKSTVTKENSGEFAKTPLILVVIFVGDQSNGGKSSRFVNKSSPHNCVSVHFKPAIRERSRSTPIYFS